MRRPSRTVYRPPSSRAFPADAWTPGLIRQAEITADTGNLRLAAELCDAIMGDDRVQGARLARLEETVRDMARAMEESVASERRLRDHYTAKAGEWCDRWHELVHALIAQQGGSFIVYDMTPAERAARVGYLLVEQRLPASRATRFALEAPPSPPSPEVSTP